MYSLILETLEQIDGCCLDNDEERERVAEAVFFAIQADTQPQLAAALALLSACVENYEAGSVLGFVRSERIKRFIATGRDDG